MCIPKAPDIPPPPPAPELPQAPSEVNPSVLAARRRARAQAASQAGFQSTILTSGRGVRREGATAAPSLFGTRAGSQATAVRTGAATTDEEQTGNQAIANRVATVLGRGRSGAIAGAATGAGSLITGSGAFGGGGGGGGGGTSSRLRRGLLLR